MKNLTIHIIFNFLIISVLICLSPPEGTAQDQQEIRPITSECLYQVSANYDVPMPVLVSLLAVQQSHVGTRFERIDQTVDLGPGLINSRWLNHLQKYGISEKDLQNDGCKNVMTLAWILAGYKQQGRELWQAVGRYHSKDKLKSEAFQKRVYATLKSLSRGDSYKNAQYIIAWINEPNELLVTAKSDTE